MAHSTGGDCKNHLLICDKCIEGMAALGVCRLILNEDPRDRSDMLRLRKHSNPGHGGIW